MSLDLDILGQQILSLADQTEDGVIYYDLLRWNKLEGTLVSQAIANMICSGELVSRPSYNFSAERPGNTKSHWGEQKNFNEYVHLTKEDCVRRIYEANTNRTRRLRIVIFNDIQSAINSCDVESEEDGVAYFKKTYDESLFSYTFVIVGDGAIC